jgi:hypothetical protein
MIAHRGPSFAILMAPTYLLLVPFIARYRQDEVLRLSSEHLREISAERDRLRWGLS